MFPPWLAGWPAFDLATIYFRQAQEFRFAGNLANPWFWAKAFLPNGAAAPFYIFGYLAAICAASGIAFVTAANVDRKRSLLLFALLSAMAIPWLLPKMHERYFFLADVLALALAFAWRTRSAVVIAIAVQLTSVAALFSYITNWPVPALAASLLGGAILLAILAEARRAGASWPATSLRSSNSCQQPRLG